MDQLVDEERQVRRFVYDIALRRGAPPRLDEIARGVGLSPHATREAVQRLAVARALVLQRESGEILMANPFSATPSPFLVTVDRYQAYGFCVWDALGILAMLGEDGDVRASCGDCGESMTLLVRAGELGGDEGVTHFAIPARRWWEDIVFT